MEQQAAAINFMALVAVDTVFNPNLTVLEFNTSVPAVSLAYSAFSAI